MIVVEPTVEPPSATTRLRRGAGGRDRADQVRRRPDDVEPLREAAVEAGGPRRRAARRVLVPRVRVEDDLDLARPEVGETMNRKTPLPRLRPCGPLENATPVPPKPANAKLFVSPTVAGSSSWPTLPAKATSTKVPALLSSAAVSGRDDGCASFASAPV